MIQKYVIIVAGGSGTRMGSETPKQFLKIKNKPILMHTLEAWNKSDILIILVLPEGEIPLWEKLCIEYQFIVKHEIAIGGKTRYHSVKNGLQLIKNLDSLVAVHDGVRPFVSETIINLSFGKAAESGSAIVSVDLKDSIREILENGKSVSKERANYKLIQTPQVFKTNLLMDSYQKIDFDNSITDDASVFEKAGNEIFLIEGDYKNIKITTPEDLIFAESIMQ